MGEGCDVVAMERCGLWGGVWLGGVVCGEGRWRNC